MTVPTTPPEDAGTIRVLLVDDETLARSRLRDLIGDLAAPRAEVVGEAATSADAIAWLATGRCDLVLLDIEMPGPDGLALAATLRERPDPPAVVFVTAHAAHALAAFELDAVDYLTKPVRRERLQAALQRAAQRRPPVPSGMPAAEPDSIIVGHRGRMVRVPVGKILYFKAELKYVTLRTAARQHLIEDSLSELETRYGDRFLRVHRNALVARGAMRALERRPSAPGDEDAAEGWAVNIGPVDEWLTVSRRQIAAVREALSATGR